MSNSITLGMLFKKISFLNEHLIKVLKAKITKVKCFILANQYMENLEKIMKKKWQVT